MVGIASEKVALAYLNGFVWECVSCLIKCIIEQKSSLSLNTVLYVIGQIYRIGENKFLADFITFILFGRYSHLNILKQLLDAYQICSYSKVWAFKTYWDDYDNCIQ
jgi:hypothetical protein